MFFEKVRGGRDCIKSLATFFVPVADLEVLGKEVAVSSTEVAFSQGTPGIMREFWKMGILRTTSNFMIWIQMRMSSQIAAKGVVMLGLPEWRHLSSMSTSLIRTISKTRPPMF